MLQPAASTSFRAAWVTLRILDVCVPWHTTASRRNGARPASTACETKVEGGERERPSDSRRRRHRYQLADSARACYKSDVATALRTDWRCALIGPRVGAACNCTSKLWLWRMIHPQCNNKYIKAFTEHSKDLILFFYVSILSSASLSNLCYLQVSFEHLRKLLL